MQRREETIAGGARCFSLFASLFSLPLSFFLPSCLGLVDDFCSLCSSPTSDARDAWETPSWRRYIASLGSMKASVSESFPVSLRKR